MACKCRPKILKHEERVLNFEKPVFYRKGVLIGSWFEDKSEYEKHCYNHITTYSKEYQKPCRSELHHDSVWKSRSRAAGLEAPMLFDYEGDKYLNNYATCYHLSYDYLPKVYRCKNHHPLVKEKQPELIRNYGNLVDFGLSKNKRCAWLNDATDPRRTSNTTYEETFVKYPEVSKILEKDESDYKEVCNPITWECKIACNK